MVSPRLNPTPCVVRIVKPDNLPFLGGGNKREYSLFHNAAAVVSPPVPTAAFSMSTLEMSSYRWEEGELFKKKTHTHSKAYLEMINGLL